MVMNNETNLKGGQVMKKNICRWLVLAASAVGQELTPVEQQMLAAYLRG